jgi:hypothetical protein
MVENKDQYQMKYTKHGYLAINLIDLETIDLSEDWVEVTIITFEGAITYLELVQEAAFRDSVIRANLKPLHK